MSSTTIHSGCHVVIDAIKTSACDDYLQNIYYLNQDILDNKSKLKLN